MGECNKTDTLRRGGTLHPRPESVGATNFREGDFFDPRDLVQVKYEMLRRVEKDGATVTQAVAEFGFSRPTFYETKANFEQSGIAGLVPKKRGPRGPHKLRDDVMEFVMEFVEPDRPIRASALAEKVQDEFGLRIHRRTIERAVSRRKKKRS